MVSEAISFSTPIQAPQVHYFLGTCEAHRSTFEFFLGYKPIGASPRRDEDGTILVCSTYILYNIIHGSDWYQKRGGTLRGLRIKVVSILILRKPRY